MYKTIEEKPFQSRHILQRVLSFAQSFHEFSNADIFFKFISHGETCVFGYNISRRNIVAHAVLHGCQSFVFSIEIFVSQLSFKCHCKKNCVIPNFQMPVDILANAPTKDKP